MAGGLLNPTIPGDDQQASRFRMFMDQRFDQSVGVVAGLGKQDRHFRVDELSIQTGGGFESIEHDSATESFRCRQQDCQANQQAVTLPT